MYSRLLTLRTTLVVAVGLLLCAPIAGQEILDIRVSYVSGTAVYVDAGEVEGLEEGRRLQVRRGGEVKAELEVAFVEDHTAACRILREDAPIQQGDEVILIEERSTSVPIGVGDGSGTGRSFPRADLSGTVSARHQRFQAGTRFGRDSAETTARVNLRVRDIGGKPYNMRVRTRSRRNSREGRSDTLVSDRLYELSLNYDPPDGRFSYSVGRLGSNPFVSIGYLDGALAQYRLSPRYSVGGFYGRSPDLEDVVFDSDRDKYGAFFRFSTDGPPSGRYGEVVLSAIGEYKAGEVSREYLAVQSRFGSGRRWSIFQRAEIDVNRDWREELTEKSYQLSNLSFSGSYRFNDLVRTTLAYDQRRNFFTAETRTIEDEFFDDLLRQGYRASVYIGRGQGWNGSLTLGYRGQGGDDAATRSVTASIYNPNLGNRRFLFGMDASGFTGETSEGYLVSLRTRKYFRGGHDVGLTLGRSVSTVFASDTQKVNHWARASGSVQLPLSMFLFSEVEYGIGDDVAGTREILELGYRF